MSYLYKFRRFDSDTLRSLCQSEVYFSDPTKFNDPLDCSPSVIVDIGLNDLESLYRKMVGDDEAKKNLDKFRCCQDEDGTYCQSDEIYQSEIANALRCFLDKKMKHGSGVLSLAGNWKSPLMWSHYADQHKGICIEYDVSLSTVGPPKRVDYEGERGILASEIRDWVYGNLSSAKEKVEHKFFYSKSPQWKYEDEWRYVKDYQGVQSAPFHITGVYFGMRCERSVISSIAQLMRNSTPSINFYSVFPSSSSFELERARIDEADLDGYFRAMPSTNMVFGNPVQRPDLS